MNRWIITSIISVIIGILLYVYSKPFLFSLLFIAIEWLWPRVRGRFSGAFLNFFYFDIEFLTFGTIILGYFYGPFFGVIVPFVMALLETAYLLKIGYGFGFVGKQILIHIVIGLLAAAFSSADFAVIAISLLVMRYVLDYLTAIIRGTFSINGLLSAAFNLVLFTFLFRNYDDGLTKVFRE